MKTANKHLSQKGLSPIIIVVILAVIGLSVFVFYNNNSKKPPASTSINNSVSNNQPTQQTSETIEGLDEVATPSYVFYYPKGYVKSDKDIGSAKVLYFVAESKKDTREGISLNMYPVTTRMETPSSEFCMEFLQFALRANKNLRITETKSVDFVKSHGCDWLYVDDSVPGKFAVHEKQLWYKEGEDLSGFGAKATYLLTSTQSERDVLDLAVNNFILK